MKDLFTGNLFATESNLKIIRLTKDDILDRTDKVGLLSDQISKHEILYPNIEKWLEEKILPGIKKEKRVAYVGLNNEKPVVSAVLKLGINPKICHLHIDNEIQNQSLGDLFFSMMALDCKRRAKEIYFTLPESLWVDKKAFFKSFGFHEAVKSNRQYRSSEDELWSSASFNVMWGHVLNKLPKIISSLTKTYDNIFNGILMSVKPEYVEKIQSGEKLVEIRKRFSTKWRNCSVTIYSTKPDQAIYGYATIENVIKDTPENIWLRYGDFIGCTKKEFDAYIASSEKIYAIFLKDFKPYLNPIYLSQISYLLNRKGPKPPESYISLEKNQDWAKAVSIAELLHNRFWLYTIVL